MPIPDGTVDIIKLKNGAVTAYKWIRDSWARKKIIALQQAVSSIVVPTRTSQLTNDSGYITQADVPSASSTTPAMDGTASAGSSTAWARGDHVHPHDTTKQDALSAAQLAAVNSGVTADDFAVNDPDVRIVAARIKPTLTNGSHYNTYGNCYYYKYGHRVTVHIGVSGLTANTDTTLWTLPTGYKPLSAIGFMGNAGSLLGNAAFRITKAGAVRVASATPTALGQITYDAFEDSET